MRYAEAFASTSGTYPVLGADGWHPVHNTHARAKPGTKRGLSATTTTTCMDASGSARENYNQY